MACSHRMLALPLLWVFNVNSDYSHRVLVSFQIVTLGGSTNDVLLILLPFCSHRHKFDQTSRGGGVMVVTSALEARDYGLKSPSTLILPE